jgi:hypothetical protein
LTDLAIHNTPNASELFNLLVNDFCAHESDTFIDKFQKEKLYEMLSEGVNNLGITPLEYMAERGAFVFMQHVMQYDDLFCNKYHLNSRPSSKSSTDCHFVNKIIELDVCTLEKCGYGIFRSFIECQHKGIQCEAEINNFQKWPLVNEIIKKKTKLFRPIVIFHNIVEVVFTMLLVYYMWNTGGGS